MLVSSQGSTKPNVAPGAFHDVRRHPEYQGSKGLTWQCRYEREFLADLDALGVRRPDLMPRVSDYVPQIIDYIAQIQTNGLAYEKEGSVYFDTTAFECASPLVPALPAPPAYPPKAYSPT